MTQRPQKVSPLCENRGAHLFLYTSVYANDTNWMPVATVRERGKPGNLPGGKCEPGESFMHALKRELCEELHDGGGYLASLINERTSYVDSVCEGVHSRIYILEVSQDTPSRVRALMNTDPLIEVHSMVSLYNKDYLHMWNVAPYTERHVSHVLKALSDPEDFMLSSASQLKHIGSALPPVTRQEAECYDDSDDADLESALGLLRINELVVGKTYTMASSGGMGPIMMGRLVRPPWMSGDTTSKQLMAEFEHAGTFRYACEWSASDNAERSLFMLVD